MPKLDGTEHPCIEEHIKAIHKHLHTQFCGVVTKFVQELDELLRLMNHQHTPETLKHFKKQLKNACARYCANESQDLAQCIIQFCQECELAISEYQQANEIYPALRKKGISRLTIDTIFDRFHKEIESSINYTWNCSLLSQEESQDVPSPHLFDAIKTRLSLVKQQLNSIEQLQSSSNKEQSSD